ncbi:glutamate 5-kinase [Acidiferrobacter sp. SPIII_3]|jgi:glutamate 5-kinase|uniref:glutamate 5-kinase n=1 Tax=Acidiferrobacter sp. SPIII_3 TaxID=1281578 RepID=UPI000D733A17|nr:glutamate 5-kinase [Acidiferrobacter sp. SPIII_3]AWP22803.1 glutamate 5-kinase [Acidiferrobacter sp. SPIII_3]
MRSGLAGARRVVVKIGSSLLTNHGAGLDRPALEAWVAQLATLRSAGRDVVLVSSGAVACGMQRLAVKKRPRALHELQALAALGQMGLIEAYETAFARHGGHAAQVLLTHDDLADRKRYLNARSALRALLALGVVPIINENDTVATEEIRFGDNDTLAALVANLIEAELLIILTDQAGLYEEDPRVNPAARLVSEAPAGDPVYLAMAGAPGDLGRGGMRTKLTAAHKAARSGAATVIVAGREPDVLLRVLAGEPLGTYLYPATSRLAARKQWLAAHLAVRGRLTLDAGAVRVLREAGKSLLPVGVRGVEGSFARGEMVACVDAEGREVARGLVNYPAAELCLMMGRPSEEIEPILGYQGEPEVIHRDNLVIV